MKNIHIAVITGQILSFALIVTFIFANHRYGFIEGLESGSNESSWLSAHLSACLVGIVGAMSIWVSWFYLSKSNAIRDMLVVCAWTRQVKTNGKWVSFETFLSEQLGYAISHGLSDAKLMELKAEVDSSWRKSKISSADSKSGKGS